MSDSQKSQSGVMIRRVYAYNIQNVSKDEENEESRRVRLVLGGSWHYSGVDSAEYVCRNHVYYIVYTGRV